MLLFAMLLLLLLDFFNFIVWCPALFDCFEFGAQYELFSCAFFVCACVCVRVPFFFLLVDWFMRCKSPYRALARGQVTCRKALIS